VKEKIEAGKKTEKPIKLRKQKNQFVKKKQIKPNKIL